MQFMKFVVHTHSIIDRSLKLVTIPTLSSFHNPFYSSHSCVQSSLLTLTNLPWSMSPSSTLKLWSHRGLVLRTHCHSEASTYKYKFMCHDSTAPLHASQHGDLLASGNPHTHRPGSLIKKRHAGVFQEKLARAILVVVVAQNRAKHPCAERPRLVRVCRVIAISGWKFSTTPPQHCRESIQQPSALNQVRVDIIYLGFENCLVLACL